MTISTQAFLAINVGASANDGTGDSLRAAFVKLNANFSNIGSIGFDAGNIAATGAVEVTGNVAFGGAIVNSGYQLYQPTANVAITANVNVSRVILAPKLITVPVGCNNTRFTFVLTATATLAVGLLC